jgi:membrane-associated phospholipid phosphatase
MSTQYGIPGHLLGRASQVTRPGDRYGCGSRSVHRPGILLALLLVLVGGSSVRAESRYNAQRFVYETRDFVTQPATWRGPDWLRLGLITGGTALVMQVDQPIRAAVLRDHGRYYHSAPIEAGRVWGEWYAAPLVAGALGLHGWLTDHAGSKRTGFEVLQAVLYADAATQVVKVAFGRARPYENRGAFSFRPFAFSSIGFRSLPGGHNTAGWAMSTVLAKHTRSTAWKVLAYAPAVLTFVSRVYQDQHWTSDDVAGAAMGFVVGSWVVAHHETRDSAVRVSALAPLAVSFRFN